MDEKYTETMDETLNIQDEDACCRIAEKIKKIRGGNRMMLSNDVNTTLTFYRRDNPDKKCGVMKISGVLDFSLLDLGIALGAFLLMSNILGAIVSFLRRMR